jgi:hypothetical protein
MTNDHFTYSVLISTETIKTFDPKFAAGLYKSIKTDLILGKEVGISSRLLISLEIRAGTKRKKEKAKKD